MTQTTNKRGDWVPSIPVPFYGRRKHCRCGRRFWTEQRYREHYAYAHILGMEDTPWIGEPDAPDQVSRSQPHCNCMACQAARAPTVRQGPSPDPGTGAQ